MFAHGFEYGNDIHIFPFEAAGLNGATVNKNAGAVHSRNSHDAGRHVFVAASDGNHAVHSFASHYGLDGVGDHFAAHERIFHPFRAHGNSVGNSDGVELNAFSAGCIRSFDGFLGQLVDVHVAGSHHAPGGSHTDQRFFEILVGKSNRVKHRTARGAVGAVEHGRGILTVSRRLFGACLL